MSGYEDYAKAKKRGEKERKKALAAGDYPYLQALDDLLEGEGNLPEIPVGLAEIPITMIAGTKTRGRQNAFSEGYMPLLSEKSEFADKWSRLIEAQISEGIHDPVKAYEYLGHFYVEEGNKRVSVLKYLDVPQIMADVIRVMPKKTDEKKVRVYYEFVDFYKVAPLYEIKFTEPGCYKQLAAIMGRDLETPWPEEDIENLRSAYQYFAKVYAEKGGQDLDLTISDALLVYLKIYSLSSLLEESNATIKKRVDRIWKEIMVRSGSEKITLVDRPEAEGKKGGGLAGLLTRTNVYSEKNPLRIAFIYSKTPETSSWAYGHELGRNQVAQYYEGLIDTYAFPGCDDDREVREAIDAAAADQAGLVVTIAPWQMPETLRAAIDYPNIRFLNCSVHMRHNAVRTFSGRMYEAKFLMGALAASLAENHRIGYVGSQPILGSTAEINAYAIGAAMIDPFVKVFLSWMSREDSDWRAEMRENDVRILSGTDLIRPEEASREYGLYEVLEDGSISNLAMPVWNWGEYYKTIVGTILNGTWDSSNLAKDDQAMNYWWGMAQGAIDLIVSDKLPYSSRNLVNALRYALIADTLNPFDGELRSQEGLIKAGDTPRLTNEQIIMMDWLNENIIGTIPDIGELDPGTRENVAVSGVKEGVETI